MLVLVPGFYLWQTLGGLAKKVVEAIALYGLGWLALSKPL